MSNNENNEKSELNPSPPGGINPNMKMEILHFKNEVLTDIKNTEKIIVDRCSKLSESLEEKFVKYESELEALKGKIEGINMDKSNQNILNENMNKLLLFSDKAKSDLMTADIKINNLEKDMFNNVYRIDKILSESVIYPGVIGGISKFKSFHDFMDYLLAQTSKNITFRDKSQMDLKNYKIKLESMIKTFKTQLDNLMKDANSFTKRSIEECEDRIKLLFDRVDERIRETRVENANFMLDFQKTVDDLRAEITNIGEVKTEILKKLDENLLLTKHENKQVMDNFGNYKKDFNILKDRLTQLAIFIKDIRFRTNIKRSEFFDMAKKINFDKNQVLKDDKYVESDELLKDDWFKKNPMIYESGLKKYIKGEINANEVGIITAKEKRQLNNSNIKNSINNSTSKNNSIINNKSNKNEINEIKENFYEENMDNNNKINNKKVKKMKYKHKTPKSKKKNKINKIKNSNNKNNRNTKKIKKIKIKIKKKKIKPKTENGKINEEYEEDEEEEEEEEIEIEEEDEDDKEENEEENSEETEEESESEEEESEDDSNHNLSCDYLDEYSDENDIQNENEIIEENTRNMKRRKSKIGLPVLKSRKRGTSAKNKKNMPNNNQKNSKIKQNNYYDNHQKNIKIKQKQNNYYYDNNQKNSKISQNNYYDNNQKNSKINQNNSYDNNQKNSIINQNNYYDNNQKNSKINQNNYYNNYGNNIEKKYNYNNNYYNNNFEKKNNQNIINYNINKQNNDKYQKKFNNISNRQINDNLNEQHKANMNNNSLIKNIINNNKNQSYEEKMKKYSPKDDNIIKEEDNYSNYSLKEENYEIDTKRSLKSNKSEIININRSNVSSAKIKTNNNNETNISSRINSKFSKKNNENNQEIYEKGKNILNNNNINDEIRKEYFHEINNQKIKQNSNFENNNIPGNDLNENNKMNYTNNNNLLNYNTNEKNNGSPKKQNIINNKKNDINISPYQKKNNNNDENRVNEINRYNQRNNNNDFNNNNINQNEYNNKIKNNLTRNKNTNKNYSNSADYINKNSSVNMRNLKNVVKSINKDPINSLNNNTNNFNIPINNSLNNGSYNNNNNEIQENNLEHKFKNYNYSGKNQINETKHIPIMNEKNRSTVINGNRDNILLSTSNPLSYKKMTNNTGYNYVRNASSSDLLTSSQRKFNLAENSPLSQKNNIINRTFKNGEFSKLRPNYSNNDINNKQTRAFFGINNNIFNIHASNSFIIGQDQNSNSNSSETINIYKSNYNSSFPFTNKAIDILDKNVNINEKVISSPFEIYQNKQKGKQGNNINNKSSQYLNTGKRVLFDINKEKNKKLNIMNNNYQESFFNLKGKEARILQHLINNLQSNIPEYDKQFINEEDIKNMKNRQFEKKY